jgi:hypothetical protein
VPGRFPSWGLVTPRVVYCGHYTERDFRRKVLRTGLFPLKPARQELFSYFNL